MPSAFVSLPSSIERPGGLAVVNGDDLKSLLGYVNLPRNSHWMAKTRINHGILGYLIFRQILGDWPLVLCRRTTGIDNSVSFEENSKGIVEWRLIEKSPFWRSRSSANAGISQACCVYWRAGHISKGWIAQQGVHLFWGSVLLQKKCKDGILWYIIVSYKGTLNNSSGIGWHWVVDMCFVNRLFGWLMAIPSNRTQRAGRVWQDQNMETLPCPVGASRLPGDQPISFRTPTGSKTIHVRSKKNKLKKIHHSLWSLTHSLTHALTGWIDGLMDWWILYDHQNSFATFHH